MPTVTNAQGQADNFDIVAQPERIAGGGVVLLTAELPSHDATYHAAWTVTGPTQLTAQDTRVALLGATTVIGDEIDLSEGVQRVRATLNTEPLTPGSWQVHLRLIRFPEAEGGDDADTADDADSSASAPVIIDGDSHPIEVTPRPFAAGDDVAVTLQRAAVAPTPDQSLWVAIRNSTDAMGFESYSRFLEAVICGGPDEDVGDRRQRKRIGHKLRSVKRRTVPPFPNVERYRVLKAATEVFLMTHCGVRLDDFSRVDVDEESRRLNRTVTEAELEDQMQSYLDRVAAGDGEFLDVLPYLGLIRRQLGDVAIVGLDEDEGEATEICSGILAEKLEHPCFLELLRDYWLDEVGLAEAINAICWRFQNRTPRSRRRDPLSGMDVNPLRPLNNLLWGLVQDKQHRLSTRRREDEYDHLYGVALSSRPGPPVRGADSRSRFMEAFHNLLRLAAVFYTQDDNTTFIADGFPVLNALKETHLLLTEGAHNQYGDLPWTARHEMLMYQWILSRREVYDFLPTRSMVAYTETWIAPLEAMNKLQGWSDVSVTHFRDLSVFGEQLLLGIRFGAWSRENDPARAANWVRYWRPELQAYTHAYRAVTGVDLTRRADRSSPAYPPRQQARAGAYRG
jgi:hypothetical protein